MFHRRTQQFSLAPFFFSLHTHPFHQFRSIAINVRQYVACQLARLILVCVSHQLAVYYLSSIFNVSGSLSWILMFCYAHLMVSACLGCDPFSVMCYLAHLLSSIFISSCKFAHTFATIFINFINLKSCPSWIISPELGIQSHGKGFRLKVPGNWRCIVKQRKECWSAPVDILLRSDPDPKPPNCTPP